MAGSKTTKDQAQSPGTLLRFYDLDAVAALIRTPRRFFAGDENAIAKHHKPDYADALSAITAPLWLPTLLAIVLLEDRSLEAKIRYHAEPVEKESIWG
ncbi:MAG TPA: hypothetical protein VL944_02180 [Candidatus Acidoferrum sp.]|nr:hypothetical protein [Candidatus Acidoferrum sp.]